MQKKLCSTCLHYVGGRFCDAFDDTIPDAILNGTMSHTKPVSGDNGLQYQVAPEYQKVLIGNSKKNSE